jgi:hypothetical protein
LWRAGLPSSPKKGLNRRPRKRLINVKRILGER